MTASELKLRWMTGMLSVSVERPEGRIGTGSGYQTAVLAELASQVYSIEIVPTRACRSAGMIGS